MCSLYAREEDMDSLELLYGLQAHDDEAFRTIARTYGKSVYERLLARSGNQKLAKQALKTALTELYSAVSATDSRDPIEALLYAEAERAQAAMQQNACDVLLEETLRPIARARGKGEPLQEPDMLAAGFGTVQPCIEATRTAPPAQRQPLPDPVIRKHRLGRTAAAILLSIGILLMLWIIAGLLMDMELLPYVDLGYAWFNRQIAPWF